MILKTKDSADAQLQQLNDALGGCVSARDRERLEKERAIFLAGVEGEREAAYHIDFEIGNSENWAVIHDLRLEWNGRVAQIDHLLVNRLLMVYVVESKNYKTKVRFANGGWERINFNHWEGIPSPAEQNFRHISVLREAIEAQKLAPTRLGLTLVPEYMNIVLVNPNCSIVGDIPREVRIHRMDSFIRVAREKDFSALSAYRLISSDTLREFGTKLLALHRPAAVPLLCLRDAPMPEQQPVPVPQANQATNAKAGHGLVCGGCGGPVSNAEAVFCRTNKARFAGAILCRKCQNCAPSSPKPVPKSATRCTQCGSAVDAKVIAFCRFNSKRFEGRVLCRDCQGK